MPNIPPVTLNISEAPAIYRLLMQGSQATVGDLLRKPSDRDQMLAGIPLFVQRDGKQFVLPENDLTLQPGDQILFAGRGIARDLQQSVLRNEKVRDYCVTGDDGASGWLWQKLQGSAASTQQE